MSGRGGSLKGSGGGGGASRGPPSQILPRAESNGQSNVLSGSHARSAHGSLRLGADPQPQMFRPDTGTPAALLTANRHHLAKGALWHMDTAGAPQPYYPQPMKPLKKSMTAACRCGATFGYAPETAIAMDRATERCFNCKVRRFAALDPRGVEDKGAMQDALSQVHSQELRRKFKKGGCQCDMPVGRLFDPKARRPYGWFQGHAGQSRAQTDSWQGGVYREEAAKGRDMRKPWWERGEAGATYGAGHRGGGQKDEVKSGSKAGGERYFPCRSFVYPPSGMAGVASDEDPPDAVLELDFIYGYTVGCIAGPHSTEMGVMMGGDPQDNLRWLANGQIVYYAGATGIVYDPMPQSCTQRFFHGHDDDITCLAVSPSKTLCASGQIGRTPKVYIWDAIADASRQEILALACIEEVLPARLFDRKVSSVAFMSEDRVVAVGGDDANTVKIWDWRAETVVFKGSAGISPVFLVRPVFGWVDSGGKGSNSCSLWGELKNGTARMVTQGAKHICFWTTGGDQEIGGEEGWTSSIVRADDNPLCVCFARSFDGSCDEAFTGMQCGEIQTWGYGKVRHRVKNAHKGGVTQLAWATEGLVSGGIDCYLRLWAREGANISKAPLKRMDLMKFSVSNRPWATSCMVPKSLDVDDRGKILLGCSSGQIIELFSPRRWTCFSQDGVEEAVTLECGEVLLQAHCSRGDSDVLQGLATFPSQGYVATARGDVVSTGGMERAGLFVTCGPDHTIRLWDTEQRSLQRLQVSEGVQNKQYLYPATPTCIDISPNGRVIAVGFKDGLWGLFVESQVGTGCEEEPEGGDLLSAQFRTLTTGEEAQKTNWERVYMTDATKRVAANKRLRELQKNLAKARDVQADPYAAVFSDAAVRTKEEARLVEQEIAQMRDYTVRGDVSCIHFSAHGQHVAVGSRGGSLDIFSIKGLQARAKWDRWYPIWRLGVPDTFHLGEVIESLGGTGAAGVIPGEEPLEGLRGAVKKIGSCKGHAGGVAKFDWSINGRLIRSCSDSNELLFWEAPSGAKSPKAYEHKDVEWYTHTTTLGWHLMGVWPVGSDGSEVCAVDVSRGSASSRRACTGDVNGHVKLFRYPCTGPQSMFLSYIGHGGSVVDVRFSEDNKWLFSVGGRENTIFQWRYVPKFPDLARTRDNDEQLALLLHRPQRILRQIRRRAALEDVPACVRIILDYSWDLVRDDRLDFMDSLASEIATLLGISSEKVAVAHVEAGPVVAEVVISSVGVRSLLGVPALGIPAINTGVAGMDSDGGVGALNHESTAHTLCLQLIEAVTRLKGSDQGMQALPLLRHARKAEFATGGGSQEQWENPRVAFVRANGHQEKIDAEKGEGELAAGGWEDVGKERWSERKESVRAERSLDRVSEERASAESDKGGHESDGDDDAGSADYEEASVPKRLLPVHAFGYAGRHGMMNAQYLRNGCVLYNVGAHLVVKDTRTKEMEIFTEHDEDVECFAIHPDGVRVVSGDAGFEPTVLVWDSDNLLTLATLRPFDHTLETNVIGLTQCAGAVDALPLRSSHTMAQYAKYSMHVNDAHEANLERDMFVKVDEEVMRVLHISGNLLTMRRACLGTTASQHSNGASVVVLAARRTHVQQGGVSAVSFTKHDFGECVVSVGKDDEHTVIVHEWDTGTIIARGPSGPGHVLSVSVHPKELSMVTCCEGHVTFLSLSGKRLTSVPANYGTLGRAQVFTCAEYCLAQYRGYGGETSEEGGCPGGYATLTGTADGFIYLWENRVLKKVIPYAHDGPLFGLCVVGDHYDYVLTGGADGKIKLWDLSDEKAPPQSMSRFDHTVLECDIATWGAKSKGKRRKGVCVRSVCASTEKWVIGTSMNEVWEVSVQDDGGGIIKIRGEGQARRDALKARAQGMTLTIAKNPTVRGHPGRVLAIACHPNSKLCATSCDDAFIRLWGIDAGQVDVTSRVFVRERRDKRRQCAFSCAYSPDGSRLCVGMGDGRVCVLNADSLAEEGQGVNGDRGKIIAMKYSPQEHGLLATVSSDGWIDVFDVVGDYALVGSLRARGLARNAVLDWARDGKALCCGGFVVGKSKIQLKNGTALLLVTPVDCRDIDLASWSCTYGWPCMGIEAEDGDALGLCCGVQVGGVYVCGDDFGRLSLFPFPGDVRTHPRRYPAHASSVSCIDASPDGRFVLSCGEEDGCLVVWRLVEVPRASDQGCRHLIRVLERLNGEGELMAKEEHWVDENVLEAAPEYLHGLVPPSSKEAAQVREGRESMPRERLRLDHVFGYRGFDTLGNLGFTPVGELVFHIAGACVVQSLEEGHSKLQRQQFFTKHKKEICAMCVHPSEDYVATAEKAAEPWIYLWSARRIKFDHDEGYTTIPIRKLQGPLRKGISCMTFCTGPLLAVVGEDKYSTLCIFDWSKGALLIHCKGEEEPGSQILSVTCDMQSKSRTLVTCGVKHVVFWSMVGLSKLSGRTGRFGSQPGVQQTFTGACFVQAGGNPDQAHDSRKETQALRSHRLALTGTEDGSIYVWQEGRRLVHVHSSAHPGGVISLCAYPYRPLFFSGGADGKLRSWEIVGGADFFRSVAEISVPGEREAHMKSVCAIALPPSMHSDSRSDADGMGRVAFGTGGNQLYVAQVAKGGKLRDPVFVTGGHASAWGVSCVCTQRGGDLVVSGGGDGFLRIWDTERRLLVNVVEFKAPVLAVDWCGPNGALAHQLSACLSDGSVHALELKGSTSANQRELPRDGKCVGMSARYSPNGEYLAVGRTSGNIDIFRSTQCVLHVRLKGHAGVVHDLDWSFDSTVLRSNSYDDPFEICHWDVNGYEHKGRTRHRITNPTSVRDVAWVNERCRLSWAMSGLIDAHKTHLLSDFRPFFPVTCVKSGPGVPYTDNPPRLSASGDAGGAVFLYRYPLNGGGELGASETSHSGEVASLTFSSDGGKVVTAGKWDDAVILWRMYVPEKKDHTYRHAPVAEVEDPSRIGTRMDSATADEERLILEGEGHVKLLKMNMANRKWEEALEELKLASEKFSTTTVREERSWRLWAMCEQLQFGCCKDATRCMNDARDQVQEGAFTDWKLGSPASDYLMVARKIFDVAIKAPTVCGMVQTRTQAQLNVVQKGFKEDAVCRMDAKELPLKRKKIPDPKEDVRTCDVELQNLRERIEGVMRQLNSGHDLLHEVNNMIARAKQAVDRAADVCSKVPLTLSDAQAITQLEEEQSELSLSLEYAEADLVRARELFLDRWEAGLEGRRLCETPEKEINVIFRRLELALGWQVECIGTATKVQRNAPDLEATLFELEEIKRKLLSNEQKRRDDRIGKKVEEEEESGGDEISKLASMGGGGGGQDEDDLDAGTFQTKLEINLWERILKLISTTKYLIESEQQWEERREELDLTVKSLEANAHAGTTATLEKSSSARSLLEQYKLQRASVLGGKLPAAEASALKQMEERCSSANSSFKSLLVSGQASPGGTFSRVVSNNPTRALALRHSTSSSSLLKRDSFKDPSSPTPASPGQSWMQEPGRKNVFQSGGKDEIVDLGQLASWQRQDQDEDDDDAEEAVQDWVSAGEASDHDHEGYDDSFEGGQSPEKLDESVEGDDGIRVQQGRARVQLIQGDDDDDISEEAQELDESVE